MRERERGQQRSGEDDVDEPGDDRFCSVESSRSSQSARLSRFNVSEVGEELTDAKKCVLLKRHVPERADDAAWRVAPDASANDPRIPWRGRRKGHCDDERDFEDVEPSEQRPGDDEQGRDGGQGVPEMAGEGGVQSRAEAGQGQTRWETTHEQGGARTYIWRYERPMAGGDRYGQNSERKEREGRREIRLVREQKRPIGSPRSPC